MIPARSIDEALAQINQNSQGYIMPHGSSLLPMIAST
jgi:hypothetical protein